MVFVSPFLLLPHLFTGSLGQSRAALRTCSRVRIETTERHRSPLAVTAIAATGRSLSVLRRQAYLAKPPPHLGAFNTGRSIVPRPAALRRRELGRPVRLAPPWTRLAPRGRATAVPRRLPFGAPSPQLEEVSRSPGSRASSPLRRCRRTAARN